MALAAHLDSKRCVLVCLCAHALISCLHTQLSNCPIAVSWFFSHRRRRRNLAPCCFKGARKEHSLSWLFSWSCSQSYTWLYYYHQCLSWRYQCINSSDGIASALVSFSDRKTCTGVVANAIVYTLALAIDQFSGNTYTGVIADSIANCCCRTTCSSVNAISTSKYINIFWSTLPHS